MGGIIEPSCLARIDFNDWSFQNKALFDKIDNGKMSLVKNLGRLSKKRFRIVEAQLSSRDLRRWGYGSDIEKVSL